MKHIKSSVAVALTILLSACGGGSGGSKNDPVAKSPDPTPSVKIESLLNQAVEANGQVAKFKISRDSGTESLTIGYQLTGNSDITLGSANTQDYNLKYADGSDVGASFVIEENQNSRIIEVVPIQDEQHEVPETLSVTLTQNSQYILGHSNIDIQLIDDQDSAQSRKVFYGTFRPQGDALTSASGVLSFILAGDNSHGYLNYSFSNLSSEQTDQHIHVSPSGQAIKDIEPFGNVSNLEWDLSPGGIFKTQQEMLDALFSGLFFVNIHSANYAHGEITATLQYDENVAPVQQGELTKTDVDRDVVRFLNQASFGATPESYQQLRAQINDDGSNRIAIYNQWIEQQINIDANSMLALTEQIKPHFALGNNGEGEDGWNIRRDAFWNMAIHGNDQLRQRMAFALSQILVVSDETQKLKNAYKGTANYWDLLANQAFGHYNQLLKDVTLSPIMGIWLSHLRNQKQDAENGYFPDENYAREIMQLFSFGLVHRSANGAVKLGADNLPMQTYDNDTIRNMSRVFTGLSFSHKLSDGVKKENYWFLTGDWVAEQQYRWLEPMKFFSEFHDFEQKQLFSDNGNTVIIDEGVNHTSQAAMTELDQTINALVTHSSTAPFISRQLIQRLVTSNPSPAYIERVATAFAQNGDLKATVKAILLDPEARNPHALNSTTFGKVKEPILHMTAMMRLFNARSGIPLNEQQNGLNLAVSDGYASHASLLRLGDLPIAQRALGAASVFNFYLPDYTPAGELASQSLVAPELQLQTESQLYTNINLYYQFIYSGLSRWRVENFTNYSKAQLSVKFDEQHLEQLWQSSNGDNSSKAQALIDYADFYLLAGQLAANNETQISEQLVTALDDLAPEYRYKLLLYVISASPQFILQR
ncbi:DUF1800 family protein [Thalassotalea sp. HSM 43]|uniref:DUF1800 family protein n=1 Tax=Thalassotalea sp. HSM 43 TaxID=2552945 RepID=UPI00107FF3C4|nr:DUF1800 family protein [Thalassotalea sp. HSM 43]QBY04250.1 DUF1800 family protein [Thalassotalea sp. HSM 43]